LSSPSITPLATRNSSTRGWPSARWLLRCQPSPFFCYTHLAAHPLLRDVKGCRLSGAQAPHPGGHKRASLSRAGPRSEPPDQDGGRQLLAEDLQRDLPRMQLVGPTGRTRAVSVSGPKRSEDGGSRYPTNGTSSFGATGWRRSHTGSGSWRRDGWWKGRLRSWVCRDGSAKTTSVCPRRRRR